nr:glycosyl hydrolase [Acidobacteriota bacterium]
MQSIFVFNLKSFGRFVPLVLCAILVLMPFNIAAQEEKAAEKAAIEKAKQEEAKKTAETAKPDEAKKPDEPKKPDDPMSSPTFVGMKMRLVGPAFTSGRISAFAVDPKEPSRYFAAAASGGVWRTINNGTTWTPVFDNEGSYSIGALALDPKNPLVVWVGTGENNSQRSVSYGDGVYKSEDGGKSWKNVGLKTSEHIGKILIDPRDSNTVYVAAQGPLWSAGKERGLYKTTDGGKTWNQILKISENTGVTDIAIDSQNPDTIYAAAYQRRRHVWTLIDGGPESAIHKSMDAGATWKKVRAGLPTVDMGRIGLTISPADNNVLYATVEAADKKGGIFRSTDRGESWERRNDFD